MLMGRYFQIIILLCLIFACEKDQDIFVIDNLNGDKISVFGHRGMGVLFQYPGNSFESIEAVLNIGADGSEVDVQITQDSVLVLYHNDDLSPRTDCMGKLYDQKWAQVVNCNYDNPIYPNVKVIAADDLFSRLDNVQDYIFTFDCKLHNTTTNTAAYYRQYIYAIKTVIAKYGLWNNIFIDSDNIDFLQALKDSNVQAKLFIAGPPIANGIAIAEQMNLFGVGAGRANTTVEDVQLAHAKGLHVALWDAKTTEGNIDAMFKNPDYIQTDKPIHLLKVFEQYIP